MFSSISGYTRNTLACGGIAHYPGVAGKLRRGLWSMRVR
ncbi:hypothetical protein DAQ1742_00870 [Dickeya aquatica]|uniref:Uncharacterized protein n=1 Tax=Dickeya aquatica TaxID=1401087 RepID=A0A375A7A5_9GAMM|nr:hypothetical protein DAQ1742_00870 [Dickeya aquatica]